MNPFDSFFNHSEAFNSDEDMFLSPHLLGNESMIVSSKHYSSTLPEPSSPPKVTSSSAHDANPVDKGKGKLFANACFNSDGILSSVALGLLDSGALAPISGVFARETINLDSEICHNVTAKEVLEQAVAERSGRFKGESSSAVHVPREVNVRMESVNKSELMEVDQVMSEWDSFVDLANKDKDKDEEVPSSSI